MLAMPTPQEALAIAEEHLREAVEVRVGRDKGGAYKALLQTLAWRLYFRADVSTEELSQIAEAALEVLPADDVEARLFVRGVLLGAGVEIQDVNIDELERNPRAFWPGMAYRRRCSRCTTPPGNSTKSSRSARCASSSALRSSSTISWTSPGAANSSRSSSASPQRRPLARSQSGRSRSRPRRARRRSRSSPPPTGPRLRSAPLHCCGSCTRLSRSTTRTEPHVHWRKR
jgi:hypothetical protein